MKEFENANFEIIEDFRMVLDFSVQVTKKQIKHQIYSVRLLRPRGYIPSYKLNLDKYIYFFKYTCLGPLRDCWISVAFLAASVVFISDVHGVSSHQPNQLTWLGLKVHKTKLHGSITKGRQHEFH